MSSALDKLEKYRQPAFSFDREDARADYDYWRKMAYWGPDECVALCMGRDPRKVTWSNVSRFVSVSAFAAKYAGLYEIVVRGHLAGELTDPFTGRITPLRFASWAFSRGITLPAALADLSFQSETIASALSVRSKVEISTPATNHEAGHKEGNPHSAIVAKYIAADYREGGRDKGRSAAAVAVLVNGLKKILPAAYGDCASSLASIMVEKSDIASRKGGPELIAEVHRLFGEHIWSAGKVGNWNSDTIRHRIVV